LMKGECRVRRIGAVPQGTTGAASDRMALRLSGLCCWSRNDSLKRRRGDRNG
jgi:hypothetical protein